jgi:PBP1b-binding outer membrane lipoprotein LpoB
MRHPLLKSVTTGAILVCLTAGCANQGAKRIETGGPEAITTTDRIDDQDWAEAATKLTKSMLSRNDLFAPRADGGKIVLAIDRIVNNSGENVDTDLLTNQITATLNESGKVVTQTRNTVAADQAKVNQFMNDQSPTTPQPDYRLYGKLMSNRASAGNVNQSTFYFKLSLVDKNGLDTWENQIPITKIGSHNSVGL